MRDYKKYIDDVRDQCAALEGVAPVCQFELKFTPYVKSSVKGKVMTESGFELEVEYEDLVYSSAQRRERAHYRYWIRKGAYPLIRLETPTDPRLPPHAHIYRQDLPGSEKHHFDDRRWPPEMQKLDFFKVFAFFQQVLRFGQLPQPFGEGGVDLER